MTIGIKFDHYIFKENNEDMTELEHGEFLSHLIELVESMGYLTGGGSKLCDCDKESADER